MVAVMHKMQPVPEMTEQQRLADKLSLVISGLQQWESEHQVNTNKSNDKKSKFCPDWETECF